MPPVDGCPNLCRQARVWDRRSAPTRTFVKRHPLPSAARFLTTKGLVRDGIPHAEHAALLAFGCDARWLRRAPCICRRPSQTFRLEEPHPSPQRSRRRTRQCPQRHLRAYLVEPPRGCQDSRSMPALNPADTAWMLVATAMVLLMTPALGFFYGGMVRVKNTLTSASSPSGRSSSRDHSGFRFREPALGDGSRRDRGRPELLCVAVQSAAAARRLTRCRRRAWRRRNHGSVADGRVRAAKLERHRGRTTVRKCCAARNPGGRRECDGRLQRGPSGGDSCRSASPGRIVTHHLV